MLTIGRTWIRELKFGREWSLRDHILTVEKNGLRTFLLERDSRIDKIVISLARPGESVRILCVKDVIQPWSKANGEPAGAGLRQVLSNVTVVTCGKIVGFQEGIIDMSGVGASYSPFAKTFNLVLEIGVVKELTARQHEECVRETGLAAAEFLGKAVLCQPPDKEERFASLAPPVDPLLSRIAYVYPLLTQGLLHDSYLWGKNAGNGLPQYIEPHLLLDGAITSGNCVSACDKNTTWHHQNNPIILELFRRHGRDLNFVGVLLTCEPVRLAQKEEAAAKVIEIAGNLHLQGVILSKEGFGNPDADQMMLIRKFAEMGVKTVAISDEFAGADGCSQSLADTTAEADAVVSVGNANERLLLPPQAVILGPISDFTRLAGSYPQSLHADGSLEIELQGIIGATNELGAQTLSCREI
ncbi:MAG: glycine/sarcosine/betaine reductase component B subunit [Proteobacteria bacterium]|nr:glycine/sarcosine/betaine reductase component B subunit [Pseudomonadota bacterium]MBU1648853.1 glycine/sarcosine/betaine reductase component B subunit [Pseudomonadota bacterium]